MALVKHGITSSTPENLMLGAGTIYKNLKYETSAWSGTVLGATSGGNKFSIIPTINDIEMDGAFVKVKGLRVKQGEEATMEVNIAETTPGILKMAILGKEITSGEAGYVAGQSGIKTKAQIENADYLENIAFVGFRADGQPIIIIMENALCTSGLEGDGKNGDNTVYNLKFECHAQIPETGSENLDTLPVRIYYPTVAQG